MRLLFLKQEPQLCSILSTLIPRDIDRAKQISRCTDVQRARAFPQVDCVDVQQARAFPQVDCTRIQWARAFPQVDCTYIQWARAFPQVDCTS